MPDASIISVLHISDFHYTKRKLHDQEIVVDALIRDLDTLCIGHRRPDIIMFTGDLVHAGGEDRHDEAYDFLLKRVVEATGCSDERVFITPGNHDLSREIVRETRDSHLEWREKASVLHEINALYTGKDWQETDARKFGQYYELESYLSDASLRYRTVFASVYHITAINIDIVVFNTSLFSTGGIREFGDDGGKLAVPEYAALDAIKHLSPGAYKVFTTHHPLNMLAESSAHHLRATIQEHADLYLFGHMHEPETAEISGFKGNVYTDQAGAVFTQRKGAYIGYSLISVDRTTKLYETHLRSYFDDRKEFDEARDVVEDGRFYSSQEAREFWRGIATPVDDARFRTHLTTKCLQHMVADESLGIGNRDPHKMFVAPPMKRSRVKSEDIESAQMDTEEAVTFEQLVEDDNNVLLYARAEFGRTTVLLELRHQLLARAKALKFARLPIWIDYGDIKQNSDNLLRLVKSAAVAPPDEVKVDSLLKLGHACLLIDDVDFGDAKRIKILREFVARFPKVRYIISSLNSAVAPMGAQVVPEMPIHFEFVELCVLRRREMRQLVSKFNSDADVDVILDRLQSEFQEINLPFTAANGSILMAIYEDQSGFRPINRSVLIEQFIDTTLKKATVEQGRRETFDYGNKTALLAHLAAWMAQEDQYLPNAEALRDEMKNYLDRVGLNAELDKLLAEFYSARIFLMRTENRVGFRYRAVLEYFIALQMRDNATFKTWVMDESRYLQYVNEIQYYAGKMRNDVDLVDEIGERFNEILIQVEAELGGVDLNRLAALRLPKNTEASTDHLASQLFTEPMTEEERDEELEADLPRDVDERQEVFRPQIDHIGQQLLVALILYSGVVKNMELIADPDKRRHLGLVWKGWGTFLHISLTLVPELAKRRRVRINGVLYELNAPHGMPDSELARVISLKMPNSVSQLVSATLGTEKLERQLIEPQLDIPEQPLVYEWLRAALIADLRLSATPSSLRTALDQLRSSSYLLEAMIWKISDLRRLGRIEQAHFTAISSPVAEAIADMRGGTAKDRAEAKRSQMHKFKEQEVLLRIKQRRDMDK